MNSYNPLISVIIAVFNGAKYLEGAIESVLAQEYKNYELIIIDGASTDGTIDIINHYTNSIQYTISEVDKGIYDAWNKGLQVATGDWIVFIGADDMLYPYAFKSYVDFIYWHPDRDNLEFVSSKIQIIDDNFNIIQIVGEAWKWLHFKDKMITWHVGTFHSKQLFTKYGIFDEKFKISGDYELLLRPRELLIAAYNPDVTVRMRDGGVSARLLYNAIDETYNAKIKNGLVSPILATILSRKDKFKLFIKVSLTKAGFLGKI